MKKIFILGALLLASIPAHAQLLFGEVFGGVITQPAAAPTFSPSAGTYSGAQTVTISSTIGSIECWNTTGSPATNGTTGCTTGTLINTNTGTACVTSHTVCGDITVSTSETVYAAVGGVGHTDATGSAAYTITAAFPPTFVQANAASCIVGNVYSNTCSLSGVVSGHSLTALVTAGTATAPSSVTDNGTSMSCKSGIAGGSAYGITICTISGVASGAHSITANWPSGDGGASQMVVAEYTAGTLDQTPPNGVNGTFSTTPNCPTYTTVSGNVTLISGWATNASSYPTAPSGFTSRAQFHDTTNGSIIVLADNSPTGIVTPGTPTTPQWGSTNNNWDCLVTGIHP